LHRQQFETYEQNVDVASPGKISVDAHDGVINCIYYVKRIVLFSRVVEFLLRSLNERPVLLWRSCLLIIAVVPKVSDTLSFIKTYCNHIA